MPCPWVDVGENTIIYGEPLIDNLDWTVNSGNTQSADTGPDNDHTLGNANGRFIYSGEMEIKTTMEDIVKCYI